MVTEYIRGRLTAERPGGEYVELSDRLISCCAIDAPETLGEIISEDSDLAVEYLDDGWTVTLAIYDPDEGPDAGPLVTVTLQPDDDEQRRTA